MKILLKTIFKRIKNLQNCLNHICIVVLNTKQIRRLKNKEIIHVAFLTMYSGDCQCYSLFEKMQKSDFFKPFFIVNPDIARSNKNLVDNYLLTKNFLVKKYGNSFVLDGYNVESEEFYDLRQKFDLAITNNPYDSMANKYFKSSFWARKCPLMYISYFYFGRDIDVSKSIVNSRFFGNLWTYFSENNLVTNWIQKESIYKGKNVITTGYPKLDSLYTNHKKDEKIKIILALHHTIGKFGVGSFSIGTFLDSYSVIEQLPQKYPEIEFIFRPHPLLRQNLEKNDIWGPHKTKDWFDKFLSNKNVVYSTSGDYFDLFMNSSAMIHDCGSFTAEYLCTQKPCAYLIKKDLNMKKTFTEFGENCINNHYVYEDYSKIYDFIENIVINKNDCLKEKREFFSKNFILFNYPNATNSIYDYLYKSLHSKKQSQRRTNAN